MPLSVESVMSVCKQSLESEVIMPESPGSKTFLMCSFRLYFIKVLISCILLKIENGQLFQIIKMWALTIENYINGKIKLQFWPSHRSDKSTTYCSCAWFNNAHPEMCAVTVVYSEAQENTYFHSQKMNQNKRFK